MGRFVTALGLAVVMAVIGAVMRDSDGAAGTLGGWLLVAAAPVVLYGVVGLAVGQALEDHRKAGS